jgi:hypothetical protein
LDREFGDNTRLAATAPNVWLAPAMERVQYLLPNIELQEPITTNESRVPTVRRRAQDDDLGIDAAYRSFVMLRFEVGLAEVLADRIA